MTARCRSLPARATACGRFLLTLTTTSDSISRSWSVCASRGRRRRRCCACRSSTALFTARISPSTPVVGAAQAAVVVGIKGLRLAVRQRGAPLLSLRRTGGRGGASSSSSSSSSSGVRANMTLTWSDLWGPPLGTAAGVAMPPYPLTSVRAAVGVGDWALLVAAVFTPTWLLGERCRIPQATTSTSSHTSRSGCCFLLHQ